MSIDEITTYTAEGIGLSSKSADRNSPPASNSALGAATCRHDPSLLQNAFHSIFLIFARVTRTIVCSLSRTTQTENEDVKEKTRVIITVTDRRQISHKLLHFTAF